MSPFLCQLDNTPTGSALQLKFEEHHQHVVWGGIFFFNVVYEVYIVNWRPFLPKTTPYTMTYATCPRLGQTKILKKENGFKWHAESEILNACSMLNELIELRPSTSIFSEIASSATFSRISSSNNALALPQRIKHRFDLEMMEETKMSTSLACWTEGRSVSEYTRSTSTPELYIFQFYLTRRDYNYTDISFATPSWTSLLRRF